MSGLFFLENICFPSKLKQIVHFRAYIKNWEKLSTFLWNWKNKDENINNLESLKFINVEKWTFFSLVSDFSIFPVFPGPKIHLFSKNMSAGV